MKRVTTAAMAAMLLIGSAVPASAQSYVVKEGDMLWQIAQRNNTTVNQIVRDNRLSNPNMIYPGQVLELLASSEARVEKVTFESEGKQLVGNLYFPVNYRAGQKYTALVITGSWTTVKEQMAGTYAEKLAEQGFITLAYDPRGFGESEGDIPNYENPTFKIQDIKNAVTYLESRNDVNHIGAFGVCAGAGYTLVAASEDDRIEAVATAASWIHDEEAVKLFYGGEEGVAARIAAAQVAKAKYEETGEIDYIKAISTTDETAAMFGPYDYYLNSERGAVPEWDADKFAVMTWEDWLTFNPRSSAVNLDAPTLMIHSDGAVLPEYTKIYFDEINTADKKLVWVGTDILPSPFHQFNFYDVDTEVNLTVDESVQWFTEKLGQ